MDMKNIFYFIFIPYAAAAAVALALPNSCNELTTMPRHSSVRLIVFSWNINTNTITKIFTHIHINNCYTFEECIKNICSATKKNCEKLWE